MYDVLTADLAAPSSWEQIRTEFRSRDFMTLRQLAITIPGLDVDALDRLLDPHRDPSPSEAEMVAPLGGAFSAAAARPSALPVLAALVYGFCLNRWEHSTDHAAVAAMATSGQAACAALHIPADGNGAGSDRLVALVLLDLAVGASQRVVGPGRAGGIAAAVQAQHRATGGRAVRVGTGVREPHTRHLAEPDRPYLGAPQHPAGHRARVQPPTPNRVRDPRPAAV